MNCKKETFLQKIIGTSQPRRLAREALRYIGPGVLVTVGFIDPGNWAANIAAGSQYGYELLWMVTLSTVMLILLQHNAAHLGIATGLCISEAANRYIQKSYARVLLSTAMLAAISTTLAELLGGAIALNMLFGLDIRVGALIATAVVLFLLLSNSYGRLEKYIICFVSLIGLSFLFELTVINADWEKVACGLFTPSLPPGSLPIVMSVLGAVVMPHNLFLHSEIIQSRQWNLMEAAVIKKQLRFEFLDTLLSMSLGWAINSAMIIVAAAAFFANSIAVDELPQAVATLRPIAGNAAALIFALALLFAGIASSVTAGMAGGSIMSGMFGEHYDVKDRHSRIGVVLTCVVALAVIFFIKSPFQGLLYSQMFLSMQLPLTIFLQIYLTSSKKVMGDFANRRMTNILLLLVGGVVTFLNVLLLYQMLF